MVKHSTLLSTITEAYGLTILIDEATKEEVKDKFLIREVDSITITSRSMLGYGFSQGPGAVDFCDQDCNAEPIRVFEILAPIGKDLSQDFTTSMICFELGLAEYRSRNWQEALVHFRKAVQLSNDEPSKTFISRCRMSIEHMINLGDDWTGSWIFQI